MPTSGNYAPIQTISFLNTDPQAKASLWWGESLMSIYWANVPRHIQDIRTDGDMEDSVLRKGTIYFKRHNLADPVQDVINLDFWDVNYRFLTNEISSAGLLFPGNSGLKDNEPLSISNLAAYKSRPNIWLSTDGLVKSFYSTIMTDLGQTAPGPNVLLNETALDFYTCNFTDMFNHIANAIPGPGIKSYAETKGETGSLGTTPAMFGAKCRVYAVAVERFQTCYDRVFGP
ncbi:MAG: hypothetical protein FRX48_07669 [Lasallia pustulata]|uniref:Uncharacterized protein n=1 Tax=Lasallia pustulata TaxID=136370 RepID=A0A5M8PGS5_9LECA|nr:MAG: hypothetical protein FRX48_07669 [Lasallia pustulata]